MTRETVKFEGIDFTADGGGGPIPDYYGGLHWWAIFAIDTSALPPDNGYKVGTHSGNSAGYNDPGVGITQKFTSDITFTLKSMYLAALSAPADVTFTAFVDGNKVGHKTFHVLAGDDQFRFGHKFQHITSVEIDSGATKAVMDDIKIIFDGDIPGGAAKGDADWHFGHGDDVALAAMHATALAGTNVLHHGVDLWALL